MERRILFASLVALTAGCGLEAYGLPDGDASFLDHVLGDGSASDGSTSIDDATASMDAPISDAGPSDSSTSDTGSVACTTGFSCGALGCMANCQGCPGAPFACASKKSCESSCSACPAHDVECYLCDSGLPVGRCDTHSTSECLGASYQHCSCAILPCLSLAQVCVNVPGQGIHNECRTCGEDKSNGGGCGIFQQCNESSATCN